MPRRALSKNRPWIYVAVDEMSEYDLLAAQQLIVMDPRTSLNNDLAFGDATKPASTAVSPTKRKQSDYAMTETSPSKRVKPKKSKPAAKKLGIPRKVQPTRHMINTKPAVSGDIYEFPNANPEKPHSSQATNTKMQCSKKAAPLSEAAEGPTVNQSRPVSKAPRASKRSTRATATAEGHGSAFLSGGVNLITKSGRKIGRPKKQMNATELSKKPGRKFGRPNKQTAAVKKVPMPTPSPRSDRAKYRNRNRDATRAIPKVREGSKGSPKKPPQATIDHDDGGDISEVDEGELRQEKADDNEENDENEDGDEDVAETPQSGQGEVEEDMEGLEEEVSDHESSSQMENHDEVAGEHLDLLGQHKEWEKVVTTAESVHRTELRTQIIKGLHVEIKKARSLYKRLEAFGGMDQDALKGLNEQLQESFESIEDQINEISEHNALTKRSETIKDIYGRAIPAMVFLLKHALSLRTSQPRGLDNFHALEEIVRIQDMIVRLCEKAKRWRVRPITTRPILKPATAVIFPYIRDMRNKFFLPKLNILRIKEKVKQNALKTAKEEEARFNQSQRDAHLTTQQRSQRDPRILESIEKEAQRRRHERNLGRQVVPVVQAIRDDGTEDRPIIVQPAQRNGPRRWTKEATQELVVELYRSKHLPGEKSYHISPANY